MADHVINLRVLAPRGLFVKIYDGICLYIIPY
jgi:hypothetical protein